MDACTYSNPTCSFAYWECVTQKKLNAIVQVNECGAYVAIVPIFATRKWGLLSAALQPPLVQQGGVFACVPLANTDAFFRLLAKQYFIVDMKINPIHVPTNGYQISTQNNYVLDLNHSAELLNSKYKKKFLSLMKSAEKKPWHIAVIPSHTVYDLLKANPRYAYPLRNHFEVINTLLKRNVGVAFGLYEGEVCLACVFWVSNSNTYLNLLNGASQAGLKNSATAFLLHSLIMKYASTPTLLDFEGSMMPGVARLYHNFGSALQHYYKIKKWG